MEYRITKKKSSPTLMAPQDIELEGQFPRDKRPERRVKTTSSIDYVSQNNDISQEVKDFCRSYVEEDFFDAETPVDFMQNDTAKMEYRITKRELLLFFLSLLCLCFCERVRNARILTLDFRGIKCYFAYRTILV